MVGRKRLGAKPNPAPTPTTTCTPHQSLPKARALRAPPSPEPRGSQGHGAVWCLQTQTNTSCAQRGWFALHSPANRKHELPSRLLRTSSTDPPDAILKSSVQAAFQPMEAFESNTIAGTFQESFCNTITTNLPSCWGSL